MASNMSLAHPSECPICGYLSPTRRHRVALGLARVQPAELGNLTEPEALDDNNSEPITFQSGHFDCYSVEHHCTHDSMDTAAAKFILHVREGRQVSQVAIADIISGCNSLCNQAVKKIQANIRSKLESVGIDCSLVDGLNESLSVDVNLFEKVKSNYLCGSLWMFGKYYLYYRYPYYIYMV